MSTLVRHVTPVGPDRAKGVLADVYTQVDAEFSSIGPAVMMMSPSPEITSAGWALLREAQLTGGAPVLGKTLVALGVAQANRLTYDVCALLALLRAGGSGGLADAIWHGEQPADPELAALLEWARTGAGPWPFPAEHAAEYIGTALFTHFVDRVAAAMLPAGLSPGSMAPDDEPPFEGAPVWREVHQERKPGASLPLLAGNPQGVPPAWAGDTPIGRAYACLAATARQGAGLLSAEAAATVAKVIAAHDGRRVFPESGPTAWLDPALDPLAPTDRAGARVAVLAGLAPEQLADEHVEAWRASDRRFSDHCTVFLLAYGAMAAVERLEAAITAT